MHIRFGDSPQVEEFRLLPNTEESGFFSNVSANSRRNVPLVEQADPKEQAALICGGGPSLAESLEEIRRAQSANCKIFALNNAAKFLTENGIRVDYQIILDSRPPNIAFLDDLNADCVLLASQVAPSLVDRCIERNYPCQLWHPMIEGIDKHLPEPPRYLIGGGLTVGFSGMCLVYHMGYRELHLYGYDCSHHESKSHAYDQKMNETDQMVRICVESKVFYSSLTMAAQAVQLQEKINQLIEHGCQITVHGSGLGPWIIKCAQADLERKVLTAVYDLGVSPPTYDFVAFLAEAERHRIKEDLDVIDVVFQPGPMHGFRDDDLPPDPPTREGMLWRICVPLCRLLPSVRNVNVLKQRGAVEGNIFPIGWAENAPVSHYGTVYFKDTQPFFKATPAAKRRIEQRFKGRYATITLRRSTYWPERNSNMRSWLDVARWLARQGLRAVFIPDTASNFETSEWPVCNEAAWDIDLRAALYEGAVVNLGVANGPMALLEFLDARYIRFKVINDQCVSTTREFLAAHGMTEENNITRNGKWVWRDDTFENIIAELSEFELKLTA